MADIVKDVEIRMKVSPDTGSASEVGSAFEKIGLGAKFKEVRDKAREVDEAVKNVGKGKVSLKELAVGAGALSLSLGVLRVGWGLVMDQMERSKGVSAESRGELVRLEQQLEHIEARMDKTTESFKDFMSATSDAAGVWDKSAVGMNANATAMEGLILKREKYAESTKKAVEILSKLPAETEILEREKSQALGDIAIARQRLKDAEQKVKDAEAADQLATGFFLGSGGNIGMAAGLKAGQIVGDIASDGGTDTNELFEKQKAAQAELNAAVKQSEAAQDAYNAKVQEGVEASRRLYEMQEDLRRSKQEMIVLQGREAEAQKRSLEMAERKADAERQDVVNQRAAFGRLQQHEEDEALGLLEKLKSGTAKDYELDRLGELIPDKRVQDEINKQYASQGLSSRAGLEVESQFGNKEFDESLAANEKLRETVDQYDGATKVEVMEALTKKIEEANRLEQENMERTIALLEIHIGVVSNSTEQLEKMQLGATVSAAAGAVFG